MASLAEQALEAVAGVYGRHEGYRALHAKGRVYRGRFTATPAASALTRAAHMQGDPVEATVRISNGSGKPDAHDGAPDGRGLATKFYLPDGSRTDIVAVTLPRFFVGTPTDFVAFTRAQPKPPKLLAFMIRHPRTAMIAPEIQRSLRAVPSYANCRYNAIHAYRWLAPDGKSRHVRYSWIPDAGEERLPSKEAMSRDRDFLQAEFAERLRSGPVTFTLRVQIARGGDPTDDPRAVWPSDRETVDAGTLEVIEPDTTREQGDDVLVFDPTRVTDGIELSDDPILKFRRPAYNVSIKRRSGVGLEDTGGE